MLSGRAALSAVLLDTHTWAWSITADRQLSKRGADAILAADIVYVSPITFFEIGLKVRAGKWPGMVAVSDHMITYLERQNGEIADLLPEICLAAGRLDWAHRDPFDRLLAATALYYDVPLISADKAFDGIVRRIW